MNCSLQARYLTNKGKFVDLRLPLKDLEGLHGLTRAIPTGNLADLRMSSVSTDVLLHLLESLPAVSPGRSAVMFNKLRPSFSKYQPRVQIPARSGFVFSLCISCLLPPHTVLLYRESL